MRVNGLVLGALLAVPTALQAGDGVIELNDAMALAGDLAAFDPPGYPILIRTPGSYRLTSTLSVPLGTTGIIIQAPQVDIDLNGFTLRGSEDCFPGSCRPSLAGSGILGMPIFGGGVATVRNGGVSNFGASCIDLTGGRVEDVRVSSCGEHGIHMRNLGGNDPAMIFRCAISDTANSSIVFEGGGLYRENTLVRAGLKSASPTIVGGTATGGNLCDDGRCSRHGKRRFYLTQAQVPANQALAACDPGFRMGARNQLANPELEYDSIRGFTLPDAGSGPPVGVAGWARSGIDAQTDNSLGFGWANCAVWTSASAADRGTAAGLVPNTDDHSNPSFPDSIVSPPWVVFGPYSGDSPNPVWCIED